MTRRGWLAVPAAVLALAACSTTTPPHQTAHQAAVSCKQQYDAWKTGPAKALTTGRFLPALNQVAGAGNNSDVTGMRSALIRAGRAARALQSYPMPACADPKGYWRHILTLVSVAGKNARDGSGLGAILLAVGPLKQIKPLETKLGRELKKDAQVAS